MLEGDGSAYPYDFFVLDEWRMGCVAEISVAVLAASQKAEDFLRWGVKKPAECSACPYGVICNGGCKNDWYTDTDGPHNYFCSSFRTFLDYALPRLRHIAGAEIAARKQHRPG